MVLLIISEIFFFLRFFWGFFHNCWRPAIESGNTWPPFRISKIIVDPFSIPIFNTILLLSSGVTVTYAHHRILKKAFFPRVVGLFLTVILGGLFLFLQNFEYAKSTFSIKTFVFGACFYLLTGFHGGHVIVGVIFLTICLIKNIYLNFTFTHHVLLELGI